MGVNDKTDLAEFQKKNPGDSAAIYAQWAYTTFMNKSNTTIRNAKRDAKKAGIAWPVLEATYKELKARAQAERQGANELRQQAWFTAMVRTPYRNQFWRVGFRHLWGDLYDAGDVSRVPNYDTLAQEVAIAFPEWTDRADELWAFLMSPYDRVPPAVDLYAEALDLLLSERETQCHA